MSRWVGRKTGNASESAAPNPNKNRSTKTLVKKPELKMKHSPMETDAGSPLTQLRRLMENEVLDYYVVPNEDAHQSEFVSACDRRLNWITKFTGHAGVAVVSMYDAHLFTDSRFWAQARRELDSKWALVRVGLEGQRDWDDYLVHAGRNLYIGIDSRLISNGVALKLSTRLKSSGSQLCYPKQNLIDVIWKEKPLKLSESISLHPLQCTGEPTSEKLRRVRVWISSQNNREQSGNKPLSALISSLPTIAWILNLRGRDLPFSPLFHSYLFIGLDKSVLFVETTKIGKEVHSYLKNLSVETRQYNDIWSYLQRREWGKGKVLVTASTSQAVISALRSERYIISTNHIEEMKAVKNEAEIKGVRRACLRDGAAFVQCMAWLEEKNQYGQRRTEYDAASRLNEFRQEEDDFMGIAYETISASGANAALPYYSPKKSSAAYISPDTPYLLDSGGQYLDGTCCTTRTLHFGQPTEEQIDAYSRVLQGHIAIDTAVFPQGTTGGQLDVLARRALWDDGLNYLHGTGHGIGSFLNVHEGPQSFNNNSLALQPGHVLTNAPGFYREGHWGIRIGSTLFVRRVQTRGQFQGNKWLGFERLTQVPIQTRMLNTNMLTGKEKDWIRKHNETCLSKLSPLLKDDKRALRWLKQQVVTVGSDDPKK